MLKINNKVLKINSNWLNGVTSPEPPGPEPSLPPYTLRLKFTEGVTPTFSKGTGVQVSSSPNIWDLTYENSNWSSLLTMQYYLLEVIDGNTTGVTDMSYLVRECVSLTQVSLFDTSNVTNMRMMFVYCDNLDNVPLFNTSKATDMHGMFTDCISLSYIPLFDTSSCTDMMYIFRGCTNVQSGALALYQQASTQTTPPIIHNNAFEDCGIDTQTGAAELAQIPSSWGGTGA